MTTYKITTERLMLRKFKATDAEDFFNITQDSAVQKHVPFACATTIEETESDIEKYYSKGDFLHDYYLAIELQETQELIGALIVTQSEHSYAFDMSLIIGEAYRNNGYMSEALRGFISMMPQGMNLIFIIEKDNLASLSVIKKLGKIFEQPCQVNKRKFSFIV